MDSSILQSSTSVHDLLCFAIKNKRLILFQYHGCERTAEPHDYGIAEGTSKVLVYQVRGGSKTKSQGWKLIKENEIHQLRVLEETFPGGRTIPSGKHKTWDKLFIRVLPAT